MRIRFSRPAQALACVFLTASTMTSSALGQLQIGDIDGAPTGQSPETSVKKKSGSAVARTILEPSPTKVAIATKESDQELVRERYADGKVHVERAVTLDSEGNFVNHGEYREYSTKGDLIVSGHFELGQPHGVWFKQCQVSDSKQFSSLPFTKFNAPFQSTVEFVSGKMNGVWSIVDKDNRVVCQIELAHGERHGTSTFYFPNGKVYFQGHYEHGLLDGRYSENAADGKVVRDEVYVRGQRPEVETEHYPNKVVKSVKHYLSSVQKVKSPDNWWTTSMATLVGEGDRLLHGSSQTYFENGQLSSKTHFEFGKLHGKFESWHPNGEKFAVGLYEHGMQDGDWVWRHANGMKRAMANYKQGEPQGKILAWNEQGKATSSDQPHPPTPAELISTPKRIQRSTSAAPVQKSDRR